MNKQQKLCVHQAVCFACIASFTFGMCTGYFLWYAKFNFTFIAVMAGMVAVLTMCSTQIGSRIVDFIDFGRVQARRNCNRVIRQARRDFVSHSK